MALKSPTSNAIAYNAARKCENAEEPRCRCRCQGKYHGARRGNVLTLPLTDPHSPSRECGWCMGTGKWERSNGDPIQCAKCHGQGRLLTKTAQKEAERERRLRLWTQ